MRLAASGKGSVRKTTITETLCRMIGRSGRPVLNLEVDSNPILDVQPDGRFATVMTALVAKLDQDMSNR